MAPPADKLAGKFIVLDGPDGSGKSTQLAMLAEYLRGRGLNVLETRDPGGTAIGDRVREILLDREHGEMTVGCEIMLYMASRTQLMGQVIEPALESGACVLCDRWVSSTVAYQVAEEHATADEVLTVYRMALKDVFPDLTVILDLEAEAGLARAGDKDDHDRVEAKGLAFHQEVRRLFLQQAGQQPDRFAVVDARGSVEEVQERLVAALTGWNFKQLSP